VSEARRDVRPLHRRKGPSADVTVRVRAVSCAADLWNRAEQISQYRWVTFLHPEEQRQCDRCGHRWFAEKWTKMDAKPPLIASGLSRRQQDLARQNIHADRQSKHSRWAICPNCGTKKVSTVRATAVMHIPQTPAPIPVSPPAAPSMPAPALAPPSAPPFPAQPPPPAAPPGWYPDPMVRHAHRWWDGHAWGRTR